MNIAVSDFTDLQAHIFIVSNIYAKMQLVSYIGPTHEMIFDDLIGYQECILECART